ncbi:MAG: NADH-quinone oxidoreductase subunit C [Nitrososphaerota archaeon]|jgi:NADH-quinone oxidoreductase subunit D|uniref:hydrogenase large subunit n=1 Tax=Candidatus Bathycorpusculum sp. TaxID=2994959 RepID=UPI0028213166|nr:NADH-quinone oxidoreductase subunit C [Candidatus Termitimicrobium sp.]MCL2432548.1 NADH-quinone oxidoreductase subunit C [Candidatus Termitimicrobium sp.]MDR0492559.1 NADH-quinone oxidoreductase subunit C [Nitrososphaerota archaeon]
MGVNGDASFVANNGLHHEVFKVLLDADEKTGITAITGLDLGANIGVYYHVRTSKSFFTIKAEVPKENPRLKTLIDIHPGALFHELEVADLMGAVFEGNELKGHFVLSENWPEGVYPLRKDVDLSQVKFVSTPEHETNKSAEGREVKIIIGPQHPALLEPEKFSVTVDGETVTKVEPRIGYVHRGIEKSTESHTYLQNTYLVERVCGICNPCHAYSFVGTVEKILKLDIPERAQYLRVIALELNRLHSHLLVLGHAGLEIGYETVFQYFWRDREPIMDLIELTSGNRVYGSLMTVGGVRRDISQDHIPKIKSVIESLRGKLPFYRKIYNDEPTLRLRMKDVGTLSREDALRLSVIGPIARASGVDIDVRKDRPYAVYGEIPFKEIVYTDGDTWARMNVRMDEVEESLNILDYVLDHMPTGPIRIEAPRSVPPGEAVCTIEAPRGELLYYVRSNGTDIPERVKIRTPTFANIPSFLKTAIGESIADVPSNFVSLDPCFSCTDR